LLALSALAEYASHFHRPLMPTRLLYQLQEAWSLRGEFDNEFILGTPVVLMIACLAKIALISSSGPFPFVKGFRPRVAAIGLVLYALPVIGLQFSHLHLSIRPGGGQGRTVFAYGYTLPWCCDLLGNRQLAVHSRRAQKLLSLHFDRISPLEAPLEIPGHLLILQLESVGGHAFDALWNKSFIMPFLHGIEQESMSFRIQAFHYNGSCDMDYATATFVKPYAGVVPYRLTGMNYTNSLPAFMGRHGFTSYVFHGNSSIFYDRGAILEHLGFTGLFFKEQLEGRGLRSSTIGFRDDEVFRCVLEQLSHEKKSCIFAITLDTHYPFKQLDPAEMRIFPAADTEAQRYLNSLNYLDSALKNLFAQLPVGTTVVMYGDHTASINSPEFRSDVVDGAEFVPCLIYQKGANLAHSQKSRYLAIAQDGSLNLLDAMSYLRYSLEAQPRAVVLKEPPERTVLK
jgi:hypothetical protein